MPSLHLVGDASSPRAGAVRSAGAEAGCDAVINHSPNIATAILAPMAEGEVIVLLDGQADEFGAAAAALDRRGLPRWAVVPSSVEEAQSPEFVSGAWAGPMLARSMRSAESLLALRRDNARLRGDLLTIGRRLTHDLRTPLNSISTANEALGDRTIAAESAPALRRSIAEAVGEAGTLLERLGAVFLASARALPWQSVDMDEVVWNARQKLDARVRSAGATFVSCETWPAVSGVPALLELVWENLIVNSLQHGGPAPRIELGWQRLETGISFWLRDSGPGIAAARRPLLFHPIDRLNELNAPRGYGLSLVQRLVELHGGTTGYQADPAPGGTFSFTLPTENQTLKR